MAVLNCTLADLKITHYLPYFCPVETQRQKKIAGIIQKDLAEIPDNVKSGLEIIPVSTVEEVLEHALVEPIQPAEWTEADEAALAALTANPQGGTPGSQVAH